MASREDIFEEINNERDYQDELREGLGDSSVGDCLLALEEYISKARAAWLYEGDPSYVAMENMRNVASLAVYCMEVHGMVKRDKGIVE